MKSYRLLSMDNIGTRIKKILEEMEGPERGKQTRLADFAGCTKALIGQLMKNPAQELGYQYAKSIEKSLGYRVDWILKGTAPKMLTEKELIQQEGDNIDEVAELVLLYRQGTVQGRFRLMEYARTIDKVPAKLRRPVRID